MLRKLFESNGWVMSYSWSKNISTDYVLLIMYINTWIDNKFAASFHFFDKKSLFSHTINLQSFEVGLVPCLSKIKSDTMQTPTLSDETKELTASEIDNIIGSYVLFKIHEA